MNKITKFILKNAEDEELSVSPYAVAGGSVGALGGGAKGIYDYMKKDQELEDVAQRGAGVFARGSKYDGLKKFLEDSLDKGFMSWEDYNKAIEGMKKGHKRLPDFFDDEAISEMLKDSDMSYDKFDKQFAGSFKADDKGKMRHPIYENKILRKHMRNNALKKFLLGSAAGIGGGIVGGAIMNNPNTGDNNE